MAGDNRDDFEVDAEDRSEFKHRWPNQRFVMTTRDWIRIGGLSVLGIGLLCLPSIGRSPTSYGSGFAILSDTGSLIWLAALFILAGILLFAVSFVGRKR
jgi:hypothetical protein